jgi:sialidase-1
MRWRLLLAWCVGGLCAAVSTAWGEAAPKENYFMLRDGLANSRRQFADAKTGRVVFLGGSITHMSGWRELVAADLSRRFPGTKFEFVNAGISSLGSVPHAFRLERDVLTGGPVDLLFVEAAVNDDTNGTPAVEQVRAMEGIVRHVRLLHPAADIIFLHFADPGKIKAIREGKQSEVIANHEQVAAHYGLPSLDLAKEVTERIAAGEFSWEKDFKGLHPAPFGHRIYAQSIARLLDTAWSSAALAHVPKSRVLPPALDAANFSSGRLVPVARAELGPGWRLEDRWRPADGAGTREGFVDVSAIIATEPGAELRLRFDGTAIGILVATGPDAGAVEWSIDGGISSTRNLYTRWSPTLHLPWAQMLASALPLGSHELRLRVAPAADSRSKGHTVRILHFLVNGPDLQSGVSPPKPARPGDASPGPLFPKPEVQKTTPSP